jgi:hypothetical protein
MCVNIADCSCYYRLKVIFRLLSSDCYLNTLFFIVSYHVRWVLCHHDLARPQVADRVRRPPDMEGSC